jgi:hypothetical protein
MLRDPQGKLEYDYLPFFSRAVAKQRSPEKNGSMAHKQLAGWSTGKLGFHQMIKAVLSAIDDSPLSKPSSFQERRFT